MLEIKDYIRDRVDDQITWYDKKSQTAQKHYKRIQIIEIIASATIPIIIPSYLVIHSIADIIFYF